MVAVKKNQPPTVQNTNETVRDAPKMSHQPVGVWSECPRSAKIKTAKISSEGSGRFSAKICTSENFPLYGILYVCAKNFFHIKNIDVPAGVGTPPLLQCL